MSEFSIIENYFSHIGPHHPEIKVDIGDDGAVISRGQIDEIVVADTMVAGVHFSETDSAEAVGHKSLAVNLSDIAAMGGKPVWAILCLTLPAENDAWLAGFSRGFASLAGRYEVRLLGGDTTRGPLTISVTVGGQVSPDGALLRSGAKLGDGIFVTGILGEAGFALGYRQNRWDLKGEVLSRCVRRLDYPTPRIKEIAAIRHLLTSAIDISDGFLADLDHLLQSSQMGAIIHADQIPITGATAVMEDQDEAHYYALTAGDDYELLFTASKIEEPRLQQALASLDCPLTCIGEIVQEKGMKLYNAQGHTIDWQVAGFDHFKKS